VDVKIMLVTPGGSIVEVPGKCSQNGMVLGEWEGIKIAFNSASCEISEIKHEGEVFIATLSVMIANALSAFGRSSTKAIYKPALREG